MKFLTLSAIFLLSFSSSVFSGTIAPCGKGAEDSPDLKWVALSKVSIHATIINTNGLICAGLVPDKVGEVAMINYRDEAGSVRSFTYQDLSTGRRVLLSQDDLAIDLIRKGDIISLHVARTFTDSNESRYQISLRFLRNLSRLDRSANDYRELNLNAKFDKDFGKDVALNDNSVHFDELGLSINLGLAINKIGFLKNGTSQAQLDTKILPSVAGL